MIRTRTTPIVAFIVTLFAFVDAANGQIRFDAASVRSVARLNLSAAVVLSPAGPEGHFSGPYRVDARGAVLDIVSSPTETQAWRVEVKSGDAVIWNALVDPGQRIQSGRVPAIGTVLVMPATGQVKAPPAFTVTVRYMQRSPNKPQSVDDKNDLEVVDQARASRQFAARWDALARSVAKLWIMRSDDSLQHCTAFLISPTHVITNYHCAPNQADVKNIVLGFDYTREDIAPDRYDVVEWGQGSEELDFRVLRIDRPATNRKALPWSPRAPYTGQLFIVLQHPLDRTQFISVADCHVVEPATNSGDFSHSCDTAPGSSGSPIVDFLTGEVVGLHHLGFDQARNILVNRGVPITQIQKALGADAPKAIGRP